MQAKKMTQKQFEAFFKKQAKAYVKNMCIFCKHNASCTLPLHGHYTINGVSCPKAEHPEEQQFFMQVLEYFYGPAIMGNFAEKIRRYTNE